jgi:hypothetical protein
MSQSVTLGLWIGQAAAFIAYLEYLEPNDCSSANSRSLSHMEMPRHAPLIIWLAVGNDPEAHRLRAPTPLCAERTNRTAYLICRMFRQKADQQNGDESRPANGRRTLFGGCRGPGWLC